MDLSVEMTADWRPAASGVTVPNRFPKTQLKPVPHHTRSTYESLTSRGVPRPFWWRLGTRLSPAGWGCCWGWRRASPPGSLRWTRTPKPARGCTPSRASYPAATASHQSSSAEGNNSMWEHAGFYVLDIFWTKRACYCRLMRHFFTQCFPGLGLGLLTFKMLCFSSSQPVGRPLSTFLKWKNNSDFGV